MPKDISRSTELSEREIITFSKILRMTLSKVLFLLLFTELKFFLYATIDIEHS